MRLVAACMSHAPNLRPPFDALIQVLAEMENNVRLEGLRAAPGHGHNRHQQLTAAGPRRHHVDDLGAPPPPPPPPSPPPPHAEGGLSHRAAGAAALRHAAVHNVAAPPDPAAAPGTGRSAREQQLQQLMQQQSIRQHHVHQQMIQKQQQQQHIRSGRPSAPLPAQDSVPLSPAHGKTQGRHPSLYHNILALQDAARHQRAGSGSSSAHGEAAALRSAGSEPFAAAAAARRAGDDGSQGGGTAPTSSASVALTLDWHSSSSGQAGSARSTPDRRRNSVVALEQQGQIGLRPSIPSRLRHSQSVPSCDTCGQAAPPEEAGVGAAP